MANQPGPRPSDQPRSQLRYWPHPPAFLLVLMFLIGLVLAVVLVQASTAAFAMAGLNPAVAGAVLLASLVGSVFNIPIAHLKTNRAHVEVRQMRFAGMVYTVPVSVPGRVTVAINVGGAIIPVAVSGYLITRSSLWTPALIAITAVAFVIHFLSRPVKGVGIVVPALIPAVVTALAALALRQGDNTAALAYIAGTVGTLIGADLTHVKWIRTTEAPVASIGGAGTFDGVFMTGILAVLLAALV